MVANQDPPKEISRLRAQEVTLGYERRTVSTQLTVVIPANSFTVIVGPNACGKSTLLRALARLLKPQEGQIILDGKEMSTYHTKEAARRVGLLPQSAISPEGITVRELVARGRYPHQSLFRNTKVTDDLAVQEAMAATRVTKLAEVPVDELSGGQRQRVWVAMALAQETPILLLDEPTTFLDISHQIELLDLFAQLHSEGNTLVAVLHDLNHGARYATHMIAMKDGAIYAEGTPAEVVTPLMVKEVFELDCIVIPDPLVGTPLVIPRGVRRDL